MRYKWQHVLIQKFPLLPTCTRKDGTTADDEASHVVASLKDIANDSTNTPDDQVYFTNVNNLKVKGPEKRGYVRLVGRMLAAKSNGASSIESETINQLKVVVNAFAMIIQDHIPIANLSSALSNPNVQVFTCIIHYFSFTITRIYVLGVFSFICFRSFILVLFPITTLYQLTKYHLHEVIMIMPKRSI